MQTALERVPSQDVIHLTSQATTRIIAQREVFAGELLDDWLMVRALKRGRPAAWLPGGSSLFILDQPWVYLNGTMSHMVETEPGENYRLNYNAWGPSHEGPSRAIDAVADVLVDGEVSQTIVAHPEPQCSPHELFFTASAPRIELAFATVGSVPLGIGNITVTNVGGIEFSELLATSWR